MTKVVTVKRRALAANEERAERLRARFAASGTLVANLISSPGSGKTTLLEATVRALEGELTTAVIEGDVATENDADRIRALGVPAHQILTGGACHLDARLVETGIEDGGLPEVDILFIENVGNLVCPAEFDTGAIKSAMILSVPEGDDKPLKYPLMFTVCDVLLVNKIDYLELSDFDMEAMRERVLRLNPDIRIFEICAKTGEGVDEWAAWLSREATSFIRG